MPPKRRSTSDPTLDKLEAINATLQDLFVIQAKIAGMSKEQVRKIMGVGDARVSRIWKQIRGDKGS